MVIRVTRLSNSKQVGSILIILGRKASALWWKKTIILAREPSCCNSGFTIYWGAVKGGIERISLSKHKVVDRSTHPGNLPSKLVSYDQISSHVLFIVAPLGNSSEGSKSMQLKRH